jgi:hypothetical protein
LQSGLKDCDDVGELSANLRYAVAFHPGIVGPFGGRPLLCNTLMDARFVEVRVWMRTSKIGSQKKNRESEEF